MALPDPDSLQTSELILRIIRLDGDKHEDGTMPEFSNQRKNWRGRLKLLREELDARIPIDSKVKWI